MELNGQRLAHTPCIPSSSLHPLLQMSQVLNLSNPDPEPHPPQSIKQTPFRSETSQAAVPSPRSMFTSHFSQNLPSIIVFFFISKSPSNHHSIIRWGHLFQRLRQLLFEHTSLYLYFWKLFCEVQKNLTLSPLVVGWFIQDTRNSSLFFFTQSVGSFSVSARKVLATNSFQSNFCYSKIISWKWYENIRSFSSNTLSRTDSLSARVVPSFF